MTSRTAGRCAVCGQPLTEADAAPHAPNEPMLYHADYNACLSYTLAQLAAKREVTAVMAATLGANGARS